MAGAFVYAYHPESGVWLAQLRSQSVNNPLTWCYPGGGLKPGESWRAAARREFDEETGHLPELDGLVFVGLYSKRALFTLRVNRPFHTALNPEVAVHRWLPLGYEPESSAPWMPELYAAIKAGA